MAKNAEELLINLFDEILPEHGMNLRVKQKELALEMLRALQENKLALCEAEVGTGKTHAYNRHPASYISGGLHCRCQGWEMYEGDGRNVKFIKEYRTSWLSYSKISQFADFGSEKWRIGKS